MGVRASCYAQFSSFIGVARGKKRGPITFCVTPVDEPVPRLHNLLAVIDSRVCQEKETNSSGSFSAIRLRNCVKSLLGTDVHLAVLMLHAN